MIITARTEKFYKIEMTAEQAKDLYNFLEGMQSRHADEIITQIGYDSIDIDDGRERIHGMLGALTDALKHR